jgi:arginyl-tRNA synthetase
MRTLRADLEARIASALAAAGAADAPPVVQAAARPEFGDYQANGVMGAAKRLKLKPRELAERVLAAADFGDLVEKAEIAGPGFINLTLSRTALAERVAALRDTVLAPTAAPADISPVVVDYSAPNLAKEMHVGHLRSTIIGDAMVRTLEHTGHRVIRQNHVGDWGTQFGMLLTYMDELDHDGAPASLTHELEDLESFYRKAKARFDDDAAFADRARQTVVRLQSGDAHCRARWAEFIDVSLSHCEAIYGRLGVTLGRSDVQAESAYNDDLATTVADLDAAGLLTESEGAQCVFLDEFRGKDDAPLPLIVQKSGGGYLYATTDLAAVRHRHGTLHSDRALYFVDKRQALHFRQVFAVARAAGFAPDTMRLEHMPFGTMLGEDGRPFRTRAGDVVKLADLLDEAEERAFALVSEKNPDLPEAERREIARVVGIGAVKYADLSKNRTSDYVFSWETMLSFDGNTAPYLQYACSRIRSLFRRAEVDRATYRCEPALDEPAERALALTLVRLPETLEQIVATGQPHLLCSHLYEIASGFTTFYEQCPVLTAEPAIRDGRLALAQLAGEALEAGLGLLGIEALERM